MPQPEENSIKRRVHRRREHINITIDGEIYDRIKALVDGEQRQNVSRVIEECALGYLHVIEAGAGPDYIQSDRLSASINSAIRKAFIAFFDAERFGEALALVHDRRYIDERRKDLLAADYDAEEPTPESAPVKKSTKKAAPKKSVKKKTVKKTAKKSSKKSTKKR